MGSVIFIIFLGNACRILDGDMPLVSTCSAAISAACHRPAEDTEAHLFPLKWGVVREPSGQYAGHCSLTTLRDVRAPQEGEWFAGPYDDQQHEDTNQHWSNAGQEQEDKVWISQHPRRSRTI